MEDAHLVIDLVTILLISPIPYRSCITDDKFHSFVVVDSFMLEFYNLYECSYYPVFIATLPWKQDTYLFQDNVLIGF